MSKVQIRTEMVKRLLEEISDCLPNHYKLTLVARNLDPQFDADLVFTNDDMALVIATIQKHTPTHPRQGEGVKE